MTRRTMSRAVTCLAFPASPHNLQDVALPSSHAPDVSTCGCCKACGCEVDAWATTYLHVLPTGDDPDPVPHLGVRHPRPAYAPGAAARGRKRSRRSLRSGCAPPTRAEEDGVLLPFPRVFAVARRH